MNSNKPLVSIVTPCYNGEASLKIFLDSVLNQTYDNIEIFFINDGSTDATEAICKEYMPLFEEKGYKFTYIWQENQGQAVAINKGLKLFRGKYLTWPDSDDYLFPEYIEKKVEFLEMHPELNMVINPIRHVYEDNMEKEVLVQRRIQKKDDNLFRDFIIGHNSYYPPGGYMITANSFFKAYPNREIYNSRQGQNIQMLLPIAYMHSYGYLDDVLYNYIIHPNSHAHKKRTFEEALGRSDELTDLYDIVMKQINMSDSEYKKYKVLLEHERWRRHFYFAIQYRDRKYMNKVYRKYKQTGQVLFKDFVLHIVRNFVW